MVLSMISGLFGEKEVLKMIAKTGIIEDTIMGLCDQDEEVMF